MNRHLGKTPDSGWDAKLKKMKYRRHNYSTMYTPNRTLYAGRDYAIATVRDSNSTANHSMSTIYANSNNYFFKKTRILTDMMGDKTQAQSFTMVVVIASIFFFCTIALTAALVVFCKKRNSVFALQKSEQDTDPDYEMDEYNTDMEFTETDYDSETDYHESFRMRSPGATNSPARQPLVSPSTPSKVRLVCSHGTQTGDPRGKYQQITSPCEPGVMNDDNDSDNDDIPLRSTYLKHPNKTYYAFAAVSSSDANSNQDGCTQEQPMKTVPCTDDPSNYNNTVSNTQHVNVAAETHAQSDNTAESNTHACSIYVAIENGCVVPNGLYPPENIAVTDQKMEKQQILLTTSQSTLHDTNPWGDRTPLIHASYDDTQQPQPSPFTDILSSPLPSPMPELSLSPLTTKSPTDVQRSTPTKSQFSLFAADDTAVNRQLSCDQVHRVETTSPRSVRIHKSETTNSIFTAEPRQYDQTNRAFIGSSETMLHESADATNASVGVIKVPMQVPNVRNHKLISRSVTSPVLSMKYTVCQK